MVQFPRSSQEFGMFIPASAITLPSTPSTKIATRLDKHHERDQFAERADAYLPTV